MAKEATKRKSTPPKKKPAEERELTDQQRKFALRYVVHGNRSRAALEAGYGKGAPGSQAWVLLQNPKVASYVSELREQMNRESGLERIHLIDRLLSMLDTSVDEVADFESAALNEELGKDFMVAVKMVEKKSSDKFGDSLKVEMVDKIAVMDRLITLMGWNGTGGGGDEDNARRIVDAYNDHLAKMRAKIQAEGPDVD